MVTVPRPWQASWGRAAPLLGALGLLGQNCQRDAMSVTKDERLQIRVDPAEKRLLEPAAEASHVSVSAFVLQSAAVQAASVLADRRLIELSAQTAAAYSEALEQPAAVDRRLAAALKRPRELRWFD